MKNIIDLHNHNVFLKPCEIVVARKTVLISTVLGSCVAVTMFEPISGVGAICHAMLPSNPGQDNTLRYVDTALQETYRVVMEYGSGKDLVVKMFGGANVLDSVNNLSQKPTVGEQNVSSAEEVLKSMQLTVAVRDVGGRSGRRLYFSTKTGDVYLKHMRVRNPQLKKEIL